VKFSSVEDFTCCGAGCLTEEFPKLNLALNARNLAIAEKGDQDVLTLCNTCFLSLRKSQVELEIPSLRDEINAELTKEGLEYKGKAEVHHFLHLLANIGPDKLRSMVKRPLVGLQVAPFYGCHLIRPQKIVGAASMQEPSILEELIQATGATALSYKERLDCCGFHILLVDEETSLHMASHCLDGAKGCGADLMVTPCTLCHISLDMYQGRAGRLVGRAYDIPVLHLAQLMGLAFGLSPRKLHLRNHFVSARPLFSKIE
jgi:succinate dehydrogenase / fumarate reductase cytochrome b subunit